MFAKSNRSIIALFLALYMTSGLSGPINHGEYVSATQAISAEVVTSGEPVLPASDQIYCASFPEAPRKDKEISTLTEESTVILINLELISSGLTALDGDQRGADGNAKDKYYVLENNLRITNSSSASCRGLKLQVPLMADIDSPYQVIVSEDFSVKPTVLAEADNGNRTGTFEFEDIAAGAGTVLTQRYIVKVDGSDWLQTEGQTELDNPLPYLAAAPKIESTAPEIQSVASQISGQVSVKDPGTIARKAFEFAHSTLQYDSNAPSANKGALAGLQAKAGVCEEFASLFVATCRASGVPARIVNGYASDVSELARDNGSANLTGRRHQWAEFYLEGKGWIPADPTLTNYVNPMFGELPAGHYLAQNYGDSPIRGSYRGGQVAIGFEDKVAQTIGIEGDKPVNKM